MKHSDLDGTYCKGKDATVPFAFPQPSPIITQTSYITLDHVTVTAITRRWGDGEAERCQLCPSARCAAYKGSCTVQVNCYVPLASAALFSTHGLGVCGKPRGLGVTGTEPVRRQGGES